MAIDWGQAQGEYVTTRVSYRDLAAKLQVHYWTLNKRARAEGWSAKRKAYRENILKRTIQRSSRMEVDRLAKMKQAVIDLEDEILSIKVDGAKDAYYKSRAIDQVIASSSRMYGLLTEAERTSLEIAREKLAIEKKRLEVDLDAGSEIIVTIAPEAEKWAE